MKDIAYKCFKKYILYFAHKKYPLIRKREYQLEYYLNNFIYMLEYITKWKALKITKEYRSKSKYHWKTIENEFRKWTKDDIFETAFKTFLKDNYFKYLKNKKK